MSPASTTQLPQSVHLVELIGELDLTNASEVGERIDRAIADPDTAIVAVDLGQVAFLDSTFLNELIAARDRAQRAYKPIWLVRPAPVVWRVFQVTLLDRLFRDFGSLAELERYARGGRVG